MFILLAERFVSCTRAPLELAARARSIDAIDLATGQRVRVRIDDAGSHAQQQAWIERCARAHRDGVLIDYGFIGNDLRFQASGRQERSPARRPAAAPPWVTEWLDRRLPTSSRVLSVPAALDPRELRIHGFVPVLLPVMRDPSLQSAWRTMEGRSIALLDWGGDRNALALALLTSRMAGAREVCALSADAEQVLPRRDAALALPAQHAAETRAAYVPRVLGDHSRPAAMLADGERQCASGRHAAAERLFRAAAGAFDRREEIFHAGRAELALGRLLLTRGRSAAAIGAFERAHDRFQRARAPVPAISAMVHLGMAQNDQLLLSDAERSCRAAYSAACALKDADVMASAGVALARTLLWLAQSPDARDVLESLQPPAEHETRVRYWCLLARLRLAGNGFREARAALEQARPSTVHAPAIEALVRKWEAVFQYRVGDVEAVEFHMRAGLAAARAAHLPLCAIKLRLVFVEALLDSGNTGRARAIGPRLAALARGSIPPLVKSRIERLVDRLKASGNEPKAYRAAAVAHETNARSYGDAQTNVQDLDAVRELLVTAHHENENAALSRATALVRKHTHAVGVGFYGCLGGGEPQLLTSAGTPGADAGRRVCAAGISIGPERSSSGVEAAVPMRYLGRLIGALAIRWTMEGPPHGDRAMAFASAAATACAPLAYVLLERQAAPAAQDGDADLIGASAGIEEVRRAVRRAANAPFTVLIEGESGSGKELVARAIHRSGCRRERRFCALNCAAMPEDLVDAELFGHAKGAFTGAAVERLGLFESAEGGTVFLDEVGELSPRAQAKVLRALQEGEVRRVGENFTRTFDARLVAATNRSLRAEVEAGRFRQDLLYRLDVIRIAVPPLRERTEDIPLLAAQFWRAAAERMGSKAVLGQSALAALARYDWPGNVRELQNVLTALAVAAPSRGVVGCGELPAAIGRATQAAPDESLENARLKFEQRFVRAALARAAGHRGRTASALGLTRQGLAKLLQRLQLDA